MRELTEDRTGLEAKLAASQGSKEGLEASLTKEVEMGEKQIRVQGEELERLNQQVRGVGF